jgi:hypothetical protein
MKKSTLLRGIITVAVCALAPAALTGASSARAATLTVTSLKDSGHGSLREAIANAAAGDKITFRVKGTITLTSGALMITKDLDIEGPGPCMRDRDKVKGHHDRDSDGLTISGNHASRVFVIANGNVTIARVTIADGLADGNAPMIASVGGGILNFASLTLAHDVLSDSQGLGDSSQAPLGIPGAGAGGGVGNFGALAIIASSFTGNLAQGADGISGLFAGLGTGGALLNFGEAQIAASQFMGNVAQGGNRCSGPMYAGACTGGGIGNYGTLSITCSTFSQNQAIGGDDNSGALSGGGASGAIHTDGSGGGTVSLEARHSRFDHNQAIGGKGNSGFLSGLVFGGALHFGTAPGTINDCTLEHNEALGGAGVPGANGGEGDGGSLDADGLGSNVTVTDCTVEHNTALGGPGGLGGNGGGGAGGGLRSGDGAMLTVINTTVAHNQAQGGAGGAGGTGGNGWGGGLIAYQATLTLQGAIVSYNLALGGDPAGQGLGGGVYVYGPATFTFDPTTVIAKNHASTSNNNVGP